MTKLLEFLITVTQQTILINIFFSTIMIIILFGFDFLQGEGTLRFILISLVGIISFPYDIACVTLYAKAYKEINKIK